MHKDLLSTTSKIVGRRGHEVEAEIISYTKRKGKEVDAHSPYARRASSESVNCQDVD